MQPPASALLSRMAVPFVVTAPPEAYKQPPLSSASLVLHVAFMKVMTPFASHPKTWEHEQKQSSQDTLRLPGAVGDNTQAIPEHVSHFDFHR